jgi:amidohydrolase
MKEKITCRVKFILQAAEEYPASGAKLMAEDGVMDDIDCVVALHIDPGYNTGEIAYSAGPQNATSDGFYLEFYGKSAHAANQQKGVDAIMMAVRAYTDIEFMIAKEIKANDPIIFNVGAINGGVTNNIICDKCTMFCTLRTFKDENAEYIIEKIKKIIAGVAETAGGQAKFVESKHYPIVDNNDVVADKIRDAAEKIVGKDKVILKTTREMIGEDFSYFARRKPGCFFRLGVANAECGFGGMLHNGKLLPDEAALDVGVNTFVQFILDNMNGIDF